MSVLEIFCFCAATDGAGKTRGLVFSILYAINKLDGKRDHAGDYARIIIAGYTLAHLNKTLLVYLRQTLSACKIPYFENKKDNYFIVGTVTIFTIPMENPETIFGMESWCVSAESKIITRREGKIKNTRIKDILLGDEVFTRAGWRKVTHVIPKGKKPVQRIDNTVLTQEHKVLCEDIWVEAGKIQKGDYVWKTTLQEVKEYQKIKDAIAELNPILLRLMEFLTTDTRIVQNRAEEIISGLQNIGHIIGRYGKKVMGQSQKDLLFTIKTIIRLITVLQILSLCRDRERKATLLYTMLNVSQTQRKEIRCDRLGFASRLFQPIRHILRCALSAAQYLKVFVALCTAQKRAAIKPTENRTSQSQKKYVSSVEQNITVTKEKLNIAVKNAMTLTTMHMGKLRPKNVVKRKPVRYAGNLLRQRIVHWLQHVLHTVKTLNGDKLCEVYDLTVDGNDSHEFFADGLLVHNCIFVDELDELTEDKALEAVKALNERCRQRIKGMRDPMMCFASTSQGQKGLYRIYTHFKKSGVGFFLLRGRTEDNPFLPASQIRDMKKMYTPEEKRVFMDGEFLSISKGRVLGDFDWERNYLNYDLDTSLRPREEVFIGMDFNVSYNRASAYIVRESVIYCVKYYDFTDPQDAPSVFRHDFANQKIYWIPDVTIKDSFPQYAKELTKYDIQIIYRKKSPLVEDTVFLLNKLFYTGRLMVCKVAKDMAEACALAMRDKDNKIPKGLGPNSPQHAIDGMRYAVSFIAVRDPSFADIRKLVMDKRASFRTDGDSPIQELGAGYKQIDPEVFLNRAV